MQHTMSCMCDEETGELCGYHAQRVREEREDLAKAIIEREKVIMKVEKFVDALTEAYEKCGTNPIANSLRLGFVLLRYVTPIEQALKKLRGK